MRIDYSTLLLSSFAATIFIAFAHTMMFHDGGVNLNAYGEGWFETIIAGLIALIGYRKVMVN